MHICNIISISLTPSHFPCCHTLPDYLQYTQSITACGVFWVHTCMYNNKHQILVFRAMVDIIMYIVVACTVQRWPVHNLRRSRPENHAHSWHVLYMCNDQSVNQFVSGLWKGSVGYYTWIRSCAVSATLGEPQGIPFSSMNVKCLRWDSNSQPLHSRENMLSRQGKTKLPNLLTCTKLCICTDRWHGQWTTTDNSLAIAKWLPQFYVLIWESPVLLYFLHTHTM